MAMSRFTHFKRRVKGRQFYFLRNQNFDSLEFLFMFILANEIYLLVDSID